MFGLSQLSATKLKTHFQTTLPCPQNDQHYEFQLDVNIKLLRNTSCRWLSLTLQPEEFKSLGRAHSIYFFWRNAEVDNEINESCQCTAFIHHNQFLDPKDTDIQKRDRFQKIIMISNGSYLQNILSINDRAHANYQALTDWRILLKCRWCLWTAMNCRFRRGIISAIQVLFSESFVLRVLYAHSYNGCTCI